LKVRTAQSDCMDRYMNGRGCLASTSMKWYCVWAWKN